MIRNPQPHDIVIDKRDKEYIEWKVYGKRRDRTRNYIIWRTEHDGRVERIREVHKWHLKLIKRGSSPLPPFEIDWEAMKKYFKK